MRVGKMRERIQLQSVTLSRDGSGGATETWTTYATVWAEVRPMSGRERQNAERIEGMADYVFVIRKRDDVTEKHRILWEGRYFNIRFPKQRDSHSAYLEIEAEMGSKS